MAEKVDVRLVDDIDGSDAVETVKFEVDGKSYEIDLNADHAQALRESQAEFRESMAEFVANARTVHNHGPKPKPKPKTTGARRTLADREQNQAIREWARGRGMTIAARGRIPAEVVDAYNAA